MELLSEVNKFNNVYNNFNSAANRIIEIIIKTCPDLSLFHQDMIIKGIKEEYSNGLKFTDWQLQQAVAIFLKVKNELGK